jgi:Cu/Ag efflux protein CusF
MTRNIATAGILAVAVSFTAVAIEAHHETTAKIAPDSTQLAGGEVRKMDEDAKKLTIRHGPIANLDMPAMTMVFQVQDPALLDQVKTGDKIKFAADKAGGAYTITQMEVTK